ncbi:MAG: paraquat-inducible protein A [Rhodospirillaceae bacterium]|nr:paraquat-inducible protein A [Rhodospirillaceae bacterium]MBT6139616.1 paraquat-inducible protein A [Rhodospirillaceae bacterium]
MSEPEYHRLRDQTTGLDRYLGWLWLAIVALFALGLVLPFIEIRKLVLFSDNPGILELISRGFVEGEYVIAIVIALFTVMFPSLKLFAMIRLYFWARLDDPEMAGEFRRLEAIEKWSMADVFVVAILVVTLKSGYLVEANIDLGAYAFGAHALLAMLLGSRVKALWERATNTP